MKSVLGIKLIGLTGGIASGKSLAAASFRARGVPVVDLDAIGHEVLETDTSTIEQVKRAVGMSSPPGKALDRATLRKLVFEDPAKLKALESILHPKIRQRFQARVKELEQQGHRLILCEAALLIEAGYANLLDETIVVWAPTEVRRARLMNRDGVTAQLADRMIASQATDEVREKNADHWIENNGTPEDVESAVSQILDGWKRLHWLE